MKQLNGHLRKKLLPILIFLLGTGVLYGQGTTVSGKVSDAGTGEALIGVSISLQNATIGGISDQDGNFSLDLPQASGTLKISYVGYLSQTIRYDGETSLDIKLELDLHGLEEVVVVGYGTVKKSDLTGAISSISSEDFGDRQVSSIASLLQGKTSGLDINNNKIRIRGVTTFGNSNPLVIVDGFPVSDLSQVNPNDIEHMEVLKDASSTAIYGARGANGVILVTTKRGQPGAMKTHVNAYLGFGFKPKKLDVLNANDYVDYVSEALTNAGRPLTSKLESEEVRIDVTDWQDEIFRVATTAEFNVGFSGGTEKTSYYVSLGYQHDDKIIIEPGSDKIYLRFKNDFKLAKWFSAGTNVMLAYHLDRGSEPMTMSDAINMLPYMPVTDSTEWGYSNVNPSMDLSSVRNPVTSVKMFEIDNKRLNSQVNLWAEITPVKNLSYRIQAGVESFNYNGSWWRGYHMNDGSNTFSDRMSESTASGMSPLIEQYITYKRDAGLHSFSAMLGMTWKDYAYQKSYSIFGEWEKYATVRDPITADANGIGGYSLVYDAYLSYFGRINYQYDNKYLLTLNGRMDASPRIPEENRNTFLPSVSAAWKIHREAFMDNQSVFDQMKLRFGYGVTGNDATQNNFEYIAQVWNRGVFYPIGDTRVSGATVMEANSPNLMWETTTSTGGGLDMAFLRNALTATVDVFFKNSEGILFKVPLAASMGYGANYGGDPTVNASSATNKGVEFLLGYKSREGEFGYDINANYTYVKNEVTSLGGGQPYMDNTNNVSRTDVGNPIGYYYGFIADGIFQTQEELDQANADAISQGHLYYQDANTRPGDVRYKDIDQDGRIDNDKDRTLIGNSIPVHIFGLNFSCDFKGFDFAMYWQGIAGSDIYNAHYAMNRSGTQARNQESYVLNRWKSEEEPGNGIVPRAVMGDPGQNTRPSSLMVSSGDYIKLRQMSIGYRLPASALEKMRIDNMRFYISGNNLLTFSSYEGYDPEVSGDQKNVGSGNLNRGLDYYRMPLPRSLVFGIQMDF